MSLPSPFLALVPVESGKDLSWPEIVALFDGLQVLEMGQSWREEKHPEFRAGRVQAGIHDNRLVVFAELEDDDIYNSSCSLNERTWTTGDVFEMFIKSESIPEYYEFHVTPENQKLQLRFPAEASFRAKLPWGTHCLTGDLFFSKTLVENGRWKVYAEVPLDLFAGGPWRFSFCRYDATRGKEGAVVSSTSAYTRMDFHLVDHWGRMDRAEKA